MCAKYQAYRIGLPINVQITGCLRIKYGVADYWYFKNGNTQQCNIFRHNKYIFCLVVCEFPIHMSNVTKVMNLKRMMGQTGLRLSNKKFLHKRILSSESILTHHSSHGHKFICLWHIGLKFYTVLDQSCRYHVSKYNIDILYHSYIIAVFYTILFFETPGT